MNLLVSSNWVLALQPVKRALLVVQLQCKLCLVAIVRIPIIGTLVYGTDTV